MTKPYSEDLRTRGRGELPRGGTTVQHRREQRGAASEAVSADGRVAAKPMGGERNSRLKDERGDIVLIDNSPLAPRTSPDLNPIDPSASSRDVFEIEDAPAKGLRTIRRSPLEPHRREHSSAASPRTSAKTTSRPRDMDQLDRITLLKSGKIRMTAFRPPLSLAGGNFFGGKNHAELRKIRISNSAKCNSRNESSRPAMDFGLRPYARTTN